MLDEGIDLSYILRTFKGLKRFYVAREPGLEIEEFEWPESSLEQLELYLYDASDMTNMINGIHRLKKLKVLKYSFWDIGNSFIDFIKILEELSSLSSLEKMYLWGREFTSRDPDEFVKRAFERLPRLRVIETCYSEWYKTYNCEGTISIIKRSLIK
jgi:hypothetical protein